MGHKGKLLALAALAGAFVIAPEAAAAPGLTGGSIMLANLDDDGSRCRVTRPC